MRRSGWSLLLAGLVTATAVAQDDEAPDLGFLEYLGMWEESDEEWLVVAQWREAAAAEEAPEEAAGEDESDDADDEDSRGRRGEDGRQRAEQGDED